MGRKGSGQPKYSKISGYSNQMEIMPSEYKERVQQEKRGGVALLFMSRHKNTEPVLTSKSTVQQKRYILSALPSKLCLATS